MNNPIATLSRERLEQLADENTICKVSWDERIEMSRAMLAVMDAKPETMHSGEVVIGFFDTERNEIAVQKGSGLTLVNFSHWHCHCTKEVVVRDISTPPAPSTPDGWIKCSDRMPDDDTLCLGCDLDGVMWTLHFDEGQLIPDIGELSSAITHWMPLPAAPQR